MSVRQENKGRKSDDVCIVELTLAISRKKRGKSVRKRKTLLDDISNLSKQRLKIATFSEKAKTCGSHSELNILYF